VRLVQINWTHQLTSASGCGKKPTPGFHTGGIVPVNGHFKQRLDDFEQTASTLGSTFDLLLAEGI
jgi:hypothetical protein